MFLASYAGQQRREHESLALLALCEGNPSVTGGFPSQKACDAEKTFPYKTSSWYVYKGERGMGRLGTCRVLYNRWVCMTIVRMLHRNRNAILMKFSSLTKTQFLKMTASVQPTTTILSKWKHLCFKFDGLPRPTTLTFNWMGANLDAEYFNYKSACLGESSKC